jgi:hypothetical protein
MHLRMYEGPLQKTHGPPGGPWWPRRRSRRLSETPLRRRDLGPTDAKLFTRVPTPTEEEHMRRLALAALSLAFLVPVIVGGVDQRPFG